MANEQNLLKGDDRHKFTLEEASKGGKASGVAKREKATFRNAVKWLLEESNLKIEKGDIYEAFKKSGIDISNLKPSQLATLGLWSGAIQGKAENFKTLMEANEEIQTSSDTPNINIQIVDNSNFEKVMYQDDNIIDEDSNS